MTEGVFVILKTNYKTTEYGGPEGIIRSIHKNKIDADETCAKEIINNAIGLREFLLEMEDDPNFRSQIDFVSLIENFMCQNRTNTEMLQFVNEHQQSFKKHELIEYVVKFYQLE